MREVDNLRQKIFDLAIHGRLTRRDKGDEPVEALLSRIADAKRAYIAANKAKVEELDQISLDEMPFELPRGWAWCRLGEIAYVASGSTTPKSCFAKSGVPYIKMYNVRNQAIDFDFKPQYVTADTHNRLLKRSRAGAGDLLMNIVGPPLGKLAIIPDNLRECNFNQAAVVIRPYAERETIYRYLYFYLWQMDEINSLDTRGTAGQDNISLTQCKNLRIPLPPLEEQKRIVARVDELLDAVNRYSTAMGKLSDSANLMEKKVLDLAIRGKLTKREKGDGSAADILAEVQAESRERSAQKKTKKGKPIPPLTAEEQPFEIPKEWVWCRLGDVLLPTETKLPTGQWFDYVDIDAIDNHQNLIVNSKHLETRNAPCRATRGVKQGDVLFSMVRPYLRNIAYVSEEFAHCIASTGFHVCRPSKALYPRFLFCLMLSDYVVKGLNAFMKGDNSPSINVGHIVNYPIPLPPLAEQKRIVKRVDAILAECRKISQ